MKLDLIIQENNNNTLIDNIRRQFNDKPKKVYIIAGTLKEAGLKLIEEEMIDSAAKFFFAVGVDKKYTVRSMLETMLGYTKDVYVYSNNGAVEFESNIIVFEYAERAVVFNSSSDISEGGLRDSINIYSRVEYDFNIKEDKESYKGSIKSITSKIQKEIFTKITKTSINELINSKEIFSMKQYSHTVRSISEFIGQTKNSEEVKEEKSEEKVQVPKIDLSDIDIDFSNLSIDETAVETEENEKNNNDNDAKIAIDEENLKQENEEFVKSEADYVESFEDENNALDDEDIEDSEFDENETLDIENLLFSKADIKLDIDKKEKDEDLQDSVTNDYSDDVVKVKKVNLNNITNLIFELPAKPLKGQDTTAVKIPNYIKQMIPEFFGFDDSSKNVEIDGSIYKVRDINLDIIDAQSNQKYNDKDAKIIQKQSQSYLCFKTEKLKEISYEENDIIRIIKLSTDVYHIEIISKDLQEYKLWSKICNQKFKASSRKYGMM